MFQNRTQDKIAFFNAVSANNIRSVEDMLFVNYTLLYEVDKNNNTAFDVAEHHNYTDMKNSLFKHCADSLCAAIRVNDI